MFKRWRKTIDIKAILHRDQGNLDPAYVAGVGKEIAALVRANVKDDEWTFELDDVLEMLEDIDLDDAVEAFNGALADLYDWADRERVWLGL